MDNESFKEFTQSLRSTERNNGGAPGFQPRKTNVETASEAHAMWEFNTRFVETFRQRDE